MGNNTTKQKIMNTASMLFFQKGFHNTSVRDIAERASVNVSAISYYFKGKQGLLESAVTDYYEAYLATIAETLESQGDSSPLEQIKALVSAIIHYKQKHQQFSCFIHRELSFDSVFVREVAVTYLAKENHYISETFFAALRENGKNFMDRHLLLMQLKGMLITPYMLQRELKNQVIGDYSHQLFANRYIKTIHQWLDFVTS